MWDSWARSQCFLPEIQVGEFGREGYQVHQYQEEDTDPARGPSFSSDLSRLTTGTKKHVFDIARFC